MIEQLFTAIVSLGSSGAQNLLTSVGENVGKNLENHMRGKNCLLIPNELSNNDYIKKEGDRYCLIQ